MALAVPHKKAQPRRQVMIAMLQFATLAVTTTLAVTAAAAIQWLLLRGAFRMMQPATAHRAPNRIELTRGSAEFARAFAARR